MRIRFGFSTSDSWVSKTIRWFTHSPVSHAFLLLEDVPELGDLVLEAQAVGFELTTKADFLRGSTRIVDLVTPKVSMDGAVHQALNWLGERYDYAGLLGMAVLSVGRWLGKKWRNPVRSARSMFCSEACVYAMQVAHYPGADVLDPQSVSPADLYAFLTSGAEGAT